MKYIPVILIFIFASCSCFGQTWVFNTSFEPPVDRTVGGRISYNSISLSCYPYNNVLTDTFARQGTRSLQSNLYATDSCFLGSRRAEGLLLKTGADTGVANTWYAFSVYTQLFPFGLESGLIAQWFNPGQTVNPNLALFVMPDASGQYMNLVLNLKYDTTNPNGSITQPRIILQRIPTTPSWIDIVVHVKWESNYTGFCDVYIGSPSKVATLIDLGGGHTYMGATLNKQYNPLQPRYPQFRFGLYWFGWHEPGTQYAVNHRIVDFDVMKVANEGDFPLDSFLIQPAPTPLPPIVSAGTNKVITLPTNTTTLQGTSTTPQGIITSTTWTQVGGTAATIVSVNNDTTVINGLTTAGVRTFKLKITNTAGLSDSSLVTVTVNPEPPPANLPPVVNAGSEQTITIPTTTVNLSGSATDPDGTIVSYLWTKVSGTGGTITNPSNQNTTVTGLSVGTYIYSLTATDNAGATGSATVQVNVQAAIPPPRLRARKG